MQRLISRAHDRPTFSKVVKLVFSQNAFYRRLDCSAKGYYLEREAAELTRRDTRPRARAWLALSVRFGDSLHMRSPVHDPSLLYARMRGHTRERQHHRWARSWICTLCTVLVRAPDRTRPLVSHDGAAWYWEHCQGKVVASTSTILYKVHCHVLLVP